MAVQLPFFFIVVRGNVGEAYRAYLVQFVPFGVGWNPRLIGFLVRLSDARLKETDWQVENVVNQ